MSATIVVSGDVADFILEKGAENPAEESQNAQQISSSLLETQ